MLKGRVTLSGKPHPIWQRRILAEVPAQCYVNGDYKEIVQVLAISSAQVPAGGRINFGGLVFACKAILRQNTSDSVIWRVCLLFPLNNSKIWGKCLIIPLSATYEH